MQWQITVERTIHNKPIDTAPLINQTYTHMLWNH